ncbi:hypothetical protein BDV97DRAFT_397214 [Delphinella strobiligena]|nr:hypothetical protein BDV97DRAFT_397214 [Delphinella strobiligena]
MSTPPWIDRSDRLADPQVSRQGRRIHLRYDIPHRLNSSQVYPRRSQQGSEIIVSGHEDGLYIIWKGGEPLTLFSRTAPNRSATDATKLETEWNGPVSVDKRDNESGDLLVTRDAQANAEAVFETEEEEMDDDDIATPFSQELNLALGSPVLHLALPELPTLPPGRLYDPHVPLIMQTNIVLVASCADATVRLITLPLTPPSTLAKKQHNLAAQICHLIPASSHGVPRAAALSWTTSPGGHVNFRESPYWVSPENQRFELVVALSVSGVVGTLDFFRLPITYDEKRGGLIAPNVVPFHTIQLASPAHHISFSPTNRSQLLLADKKGSLKVYDPLAPESSRSRPSSRDSTQHSITSSGAWIVSFSTPFYLPKDTSIIYPGLARRKEILDARWVSAGRSVLVLLDDGEWGLWNAETNNTPTSMTQFALRGFIGHGSSTDSIAVPELKSRSNQRLAPMTPNTRKVRQESLFSGPSVSTGAGNAHKGGLSVAPTTTSHGAADDSVVMWYGGEAYHIPSLVSLWQRSVNSSGRDMGSLYGPGLTRIEGLDLSGEMLNDVAQFPARSTPASVGSITQRDIIVTGEYRFVIVSATRPQPPAKSLFARDAGSPPPQTYDLQLLENQELDLGGIDRLLDGMGGNAFGKPKRVGFVR